MNTVIRHIPNSRLTEGETYGFRIKKMISLGHGEDYFMMIDPMGYKILMPATYYQRYGFEAGQSIECRVDKVNCNGRIFLEPRHPHYTEGKVYSFEVIESGSNVNILDETEWFYRVRDKLGYEWTVPAGAGQADGECPSHVECLIERIKKGRPHLYLHGEKQNDTHLAAGAIFLFEVIGERTDPANGLTYYILKLLNSQGKQYKLRKKYYVHYGFRKGKRIRCRVLSHRVNTGLFLEPEHPCYNTGEIIDIELDRIEKLLFTDGSHQMALVFRDCFGEDVKVHVDDSLAARYNGVRRARVKVVDIYKSRPELEVILQDG